MMRMNPMIERMKEQVEQYYRELINLDLFNPTINHNIDENVETEIKEIDRIEYICMSVYDLNQIYKMIKDGD